MGLRKKQKSSTQSVATTGSQYTIRYHVTASGIRAVPRMITPPPLKADPDTEETDGLLTVEAEDEVQGSLIGDIEVGKHGIDSESNSTVVWHSDSYADLLPFTKTDGLEKEDVGVQVQMGSSKNVPRSRKRKFNSVSSERSRRWKDLEVEDGDYTESRDNLEPSIEPSGGLFYLSLGYYYVPNVDASPEEVETSNRKFMGKCVWAPVYAGFPYLKSSVYDRMRKIMNEKSWSGDYTVWMSPMTGRNKWKRSLLISREHRNVDSAFFELEKFDIWKSDHYTFVYMTSKDKKMRWFVKAAPVLSEREETALVRERKSTWRKVILHTG
ncbi:hypothetical protein VTL71DRAFT_10497 [Oculimacula yallundae]|uniref:Uncharacterized protein n=1 Tax=Oculimacula yallundae TaxID=86028 RepID=A0ABR4CT68_9HELO